MICTDDALIHQHHCQAVENTQMLVHSRIAQPGVHNECAGMCLKMSWTLFVVYIVCVCVKNSRKKLEKNMWWCCHVRINICGKLWKSLKQKTLILLSYYYYYYSLKWLRFVILSKCCVCGQITMDFFQNLHALIQAFHAQNTLVYGTRTPILRQEKNIFEKSSKNDQKMAKVEPSDHPKLEIPERVFNVNFV